ncbi:MAG: GFA family protein [Pseudomonadales bacterium]
MANRTGGCLCGALRYQLLQEPTMTAVCHCTHCQRQSGGVFSTNLVVAESDYLQQGETKVYEDTGDSGKPVYRHFCGDCGSPIISRVAAMPGVVMLKAGTLDDLGGIRPAVEVYTDHAADWVAPIAGAQRFGQGAG